MNGRARSSSERKNDWSGVGVRGKIKVSVTVYNSANVPRKATVFSKRYRGRILKHRHRQQMSNWIQYRDAPVSSRVF